jgi:hypothetical protein
MDSRELETLRAAAVLIANGEAGMARPTPAQAEAMAKGIVLLLDDVVALKNKINASGRQKLRDENTRLREALQKIADPISFEHYGSAAELCRRYEDIAQTALSSNDRVEGRDAALSRQVPHE